MTAFSNPAAGAARPRLVPVIMSGGAGTRLWPVSTPNTPKQFHALGSSRTMIQETVARAAGGEDLDFAAPVIVSSARHADLVLQQLESAGTAPAAVVLEPFGRNTAPVAAVAALLATEREPGALVLLMPADHVIADEPGFRAALVRAAPAAQSHIVTFGMQPTGPATGYGYIERGDAVAEGVFSVARFVEKPDRATAERYLAEGRHYWNGGIFLFSPEVMLRELRAFRPDILEAAEASLAAAGREGPLVRLPEREFGECPSESIDYAVMERTSAAAVVRCEIGWADVGSWAELWRLGDPDEAGNRIGGDAVALESSGSLVWSEGVPVGVLGVRDLIVVAGPEGVLVVPRERAQDVKAVVAALEERARAVGRRS